MFSEDALGQLTTPPKQDWRGAYDTDNTIMVFIRHVKVVSLTNALANLAPHSQNAGAATDVIEATGVSRSVLPCQSVMKVPKCLYCLNCPKFGQLILRKMIRIVATRCQIFRLKCIKFDFGWGTAPDPTGGA